MSAARDRPDLQRWLIEALEGLDGKGAIPEICQFVWDRHEADLRSSGMLFYTWQYDIRWAATKLRHSGVLRPAQASPRGTWEIIH